MFAPGQSLSALFQIWNDLHNPAKREKQLRLLCAAPYFFVPLFAGFGLFFLNRVTFREKLLSYHCKQAMIVGLMQGLIILPYGILPQPASYVFGWLVAAASVLVSIRVYKNLSFRLPFFPPPPPINGLDGPSILPH